jgi:hypothetical protein
MDTAQPALDGKFWSFRSPMGMRKRSRCAVRPVMKPYFQLRPKEVGTTTTELLRGRTKVDPSDGPIEFFLKFNGAYQWMEYTVPLKKKLRSMFGRQTPNIRVQPTESIQVTASRMAMRLR